MQSLGTQSWPGGVMAGGGGALNVGAVELIANGSVQPLLYNDLSLLEAPTCLGDPDGKGTVATNDLLMLLTNWGPCL